jgi:hypothetical protein
LSLTSGRPREVRYLADRPRRGRLRITCCADVGADRVRRGAGHRTARAKDLAVTYPIALDDRYSTWTAYRNRYWPTGYLIDAGGTVRHIKFGEGEYTVTENLIRQSLTAADPRAKLAPWSHSDDMTPRVDLTRETYLGVGKVINYSGTTRYDERAATFGYPPIRLCDTFALLHSRATGLFVHLRVRGAPRRRRLPTLAAPPTNDARAASAPVAV